MSDPGISVLGICGSLRKASYNMATLRTAIALKPDAAAVSEADIIVWCRANLTHYKAPRRVVFGPLPKTSTGKIQKYALREQAKEIKV